MAHHYSTVSTLNSIKWKKRLSKILSHWNAPTSATAMAAATEKFARKDVYIHSEDLTASQFANLTGIKTKRNSTTHSIYEYVDSEVDSEDDELDEDDYYPIWDSKFWNIKGQASQPLTRIQSEPIRPTTSIVQKGRFKIVWGEEEQQQAAIMKPSASSHCVEWKRKRASSSSTSSV